MTLTTPPRGPELPEVHVRPPVVPVAPVWEYKHLARPHGQPPLDEPELNALGEEGWELVGVVADATLTHFYFKRAAQ
jgi:hypothetical protein